jgi:hypothetical protein
LLFPCLKKPLIGPEKFKRINDGLADRILWHPPESTNLAAIQKNKRAVAYPTALPSPVGNFRMESECFSNPAYGIIDFAIFVGTQIEDIYFGMAGFGSKEHGINTILYVEIGFSLVSISQYTQRPGIRPKLLIEVKYVAVAISLAQYGNESKYVTLKAKAFAIGLD